MKAEAIEKIPFPKSELSENFEFSCSTSYGKFTFNFKWFNDRWNLWVTLPDGERRQAGVNPNVVNWSGNSLYGLLFKSALPEISYDTLFVSELYLIKWQ